MTDITYEIVEVAANLLPPKREIVTVSITGQRNDVHLEHQLLKVTLKWSNEEYALDLSGAQFGYPLPITPWPEYLYKRCHSLLAPSAGSLPFLPHGTLKTTYLHELELDNIPAPEKALMEINREASVTLMMDVRDWQAKTGLAPKLFWKLGEKEFDERLEELVEMQEGTLRGGIEMLKVTERVAHERIEMGLPPVVPGDLDELRMASRG